MFHYWSVRYRYPIESGVSAELGIEISIFRNNWLRPSSLLLSMLASWSYCLHEDKDFALNKQPRQFVLDYHKPLLFMSSNHELLARQSRSLAGFIRHKGHCTPRFLCLLRKQ